MPWSSAHMQMKASRIVSLAIVASLLITGCRSHKRTVSTAHGQWNEGRIDYSEEVTDAMGADLADEAHRWLGTPYRYGGADKSGTDCSGLVMELYRSVCSTKLPRTTMEQKSYCTKIARNKARVGDLMFFGPGKGENQISHVGLYVGKGNMIHASSSRGVMVSKVDVGYWGDRFKSAGRVDGAYTAWASSNRGKKANNKKFRNNEFSDTPTELPSPDRPVVPVPVGEIAYNRLPITTSEIEPTKIESASQKTAAEQTAGIEPTGMTAEESYPTEATPYDDTAGATAAIDLLDLIINQKVDSIFSTPFMD